MKGNKLGFNGPGKGLCAPILTLFCIVLLSSNVFSQGIPPNILNINIDEHLPGESLRFEAIIVDDGEIGKCLLYFRQPGQAEFDYVEFFTEYEFYIALIPPEFLSKGSIEYYIYAEDTQGNSRTLPEINPEMNAYRLFVQPVKTDTPAKAPVKRADIEEEVRPISTGAGNPVSIILLSPEPGSTIPVSPELVVFALYDPEDDMLTSSVKLKIDGRDVTSSANITKDLITYLPSAEFKVGSHEISISVSDNTGNISTQNYNFGVRTLKLEERVGLKYSVTTSLESKYNKYDGRPQPANRPIDQNRPRVTAKLDWGWLKTEGELFYNYHLDETARTLDDRRQTLNRYRLKFETRPLTLILGDANPRFSELTIKGTRVRGVSGQFRLGFFGLEGFKGELAHRINPYAFGDIEDVLPDTVIVGEDTTFVVSTGNPVYRRDAFGVRTTFNFTHDIKLGFNYLRFNDDISDSSGFVDDIILMGEYEYGSQDSSEFEAFLLEKQIFPGDIRYEKLWDEWEDQREVIENKLGKPKDNIVASATLICASSERLSSVWRRL
ncbi:MAG: hypothetical protein H8E87_01445 [FCB group bacterium]|nr:hypothetical protein [FCB group bacterium]